MYNVKKTRHLRTLALGMCAVMLMACSDSVATDITTTTEPASTTTTTLPWKPGAAQKAWNKYVKMFYTLDHSAISKSDCGLFAMLITEGSLTIYQWNGERWVDRSVLLGGGKGQMPLKVYSFDFTNDGVLDFFVTYGDNLKSGGRTYGAFFAYPWVQERQCEWSWADIDNGRDITKTIDSPEVDQRRGVVYARGYHNGNYLTIGTVDYLPSSSSFVFQRTYTEKASS